MLVARNFEGPRDDSQQCFAPRETTSSPMVVSPMVGPSHPSAARPLKYINRTRGIKGVAGGCELAHTHGVERRTWTCRGAPSMLHLNSPRPRRGVMDPGPRDGGEGGSEVKNCGWGDNPAMRMDDTPDIADRTSRSLPPLLVRVTTGDRAADDPDGEAVTSLA